MSSLLEVKEIQINYGDAPALKGVSLQVGEQEIVSMVGSNGAGKTTTINSISGVLRPISGEILYRGEAINRIPAHKIVSRGLVQVPEGRRLFSHMTVLKNLYMGSYNQSARGDREKMLDGVFQILPVLKERRDQIAWTLSGGEQQMLAIGRGLMSKPQLLMLDEPSLGLAPMMVKTVFQLLKEINGRGMAILLVEQNVQHALSLSVRGYVIENGRTTLEGTGDSLLKREDLKKSYLGL
jgi:branched-chain amino acid transport system ATP-binding protein